MPRKKRILLAGEVAHIMSRGIDGCTIFNNDTDRSHFISLLGSELLRSECRCYAWVLMPNHYHLVLRLSNQNTGSMMRRLNGTYARYFNRQHARCGYLFQDRFKSIATREYWYFRELIRYAHLNPLRAKIVRNFDELTSYPWSGHRAILGLDSFAWMDVPDTLSKFGKTRQLARREYLSFLHQRQSDEAGHGPLAMLPEADDAGGQKDERIIGNAAFVRAVVAQAELEKNDWLQRKQSRPTLRSLLNDIALQNGLNTESIFVRGRCNAVSDARTLFCSKARKVYGYTFNEIAGSLGITPSAVVRMIGRKSIKVK